MLRKNAKLAPKTPKWRAPVKSMLPLQNHQIISTYQCSRLILQKQVWSKMTSSSPKRQFKTFCSKKNALMYYTMFVFRILSLFLYYVKEDGSCRLSRPFRSEESRCCLMLLCWSEKRKRKWKEDPFQIWWSLQ